MLWKSLKLDLENEDKTLSPIRAGELAAARLSTQLQKLIADIDERAKHGAITDAEEQFYDSVYVDGWRYTADLIRLSGSRTILADSDSPYARRSLD